MHGLATIQTLNGPQNPREKAPRTIAVGLDPARPALGDVVIIKRTFLWDDGSLATVCTKCGDFFPMKLRRMERPVSGGKRRVEVRNVPRCKKCRHEPYRKEKRNGAFDFRVGDTVRCIDDRDNGNAVNGDRLYLDRLYTVAIAPSVPGPQSFVGVKEAFAGAACSYASRFELVEAA